jgi:hypothetical protein
VRKPPENSVSWESQRKEREWMSAKTRLAIEFVQIGVMVFTFPDFKET